MNKNLKGIIKFVDFRVFFQTIFLNVKQFNDIYLSLFREIIIYFIVCL